MKIDVKNVRLLAKALAGGGPAVTPAEGQAFVNDLRAQAERAPDIVAAVTGMDALTEPPAVHVVDRQNWAVGAAESITKMLRGARDSQVEAASNRLMGLQVSVALSVVASRVLGQYDPYTDRLFLVAPNVATMQTKDNLDRRDLCLWVAVHEMTHAMQFAQAPWLKDFLVSRIRWVIEDADGVSDAELDETLDEVVAVMSLLEGHAEYTMNTVPVAMMPGKRRIISAMESRRSKGNLLVEKLKERTGFADKLRQYRDGEKFVSEVRNMVGVEGLNKVWESPLNAPSLEEITNPRAWVDRVG